MPLLYILRDIQTPTRRFLTPARIPAYVGPGVGIQLQNPGPHKGRLLFIGHHGAYVEDFVWYSDDDGSTYTVSNTSLLKMDEV